VDNCYI